MEPLSADPDRSRRDDLLEQLSAFAQLGIDRDVKRRKRKLDGVPVTAKRIISVHTVQIARLEHEALIDTMSMLESYSTETLEQVALSFTKIENEFDCVHKWLSYNGREWNTVTGAHRDEMFRDIVALRRFGWSKAEHRVHSLLDTYRVLKLTPGSIHQMQPEEVRVDVSPVFNAACASRNMVWLRRGTEPTSSFDPHGNYAQPVEPEVHEDYRREHMSDEIARYLTGYPARYVGLKDFMKRQKQTLPEVDFEFFLLEMQSHSSLRDGVL